MILYAYFTTGNEPYVVYYKRSFCACQHCVNFKPTECENTERTGALKPDGEVVPVAVFSWDYRTGTLKKAKNRIRRGPKEGKKPQEFKNELGVQVYTEELARSLPNSARQSSASDSDSDRDIEMADSNDSQDSDSSADSQGRRKRGGPRGKRGKKKNKRGSYGGW